MSKLMAHQEVATVVEGLGKMPTKMVDILMLNKDNITRLQQQILRSNWKAWRKDNQIYARGQPDQLQRHKNT